MGRGKQISVLVFILIMGLSCVYLGIKIKNKPAPAEEEETYQGTYKETSISLPVINESGGETFLQLLRGTNGEVELFTVLYNEDRTMVRGYKKYQLNSDQKWEAVEADWMALEYFSDTTQVVRLMAYADTGSLYFLLHDLASDSSSDLPACDNVVRVSTAAEVEKVGVRGLYKTDSDGYPIQITRMLIADNMICITDELLNSYAYSLINGELYTSGKNSTPYALASDGSYLYLMNSEYNAVAPYSVADGSAANTLKLWDRVTVWEDSESEYEIMDYQLLSENGILYLSCQDGIYAYDTLEKKWDLLIAGTECMIGRPSITQQNIIATHDAFYILGRSQDGSCSFASYTRRTEEEDNSLDLTDFRISSYRRNAVITEAVVDFQQNNRDYRVIYDVALDSNPDLSIEDYRKQIQAEIQAGTAADVLVCDELDYSAYMNTGFFENISDLMKPLYTVCDLYGNITNTMAQTKIFVTPAKFEAYLTYGSPTGLSSMDSLAALLALSQKNGSPALGTLSCQQITDLLSSFYQEEYVIDGEISHDALLQTLSSLSDIVTAAPDTKKREKWYRSPVSGDGTGPGITSVSSVLDFISLLSITKTAGTSYVTANGRFQPICILGINASSHNTVPAKDFVRTVYSEEVQQTDIGIGIPMRKSAVNEWLEMGISETELAFFQKCLENLDFVFTENTELNEAIYRVLELYLTGELTVEQAVEQIMSYAPSVSVYTPYEGSTADKLKILIVGESFAASSGLEEQLNTLTGLAGLDTELNVCIHSGSSLQEQRVYMEGSDYQTYQWIRNADIIILQEKGVSLPDTVQALYHIKDYCADDSRVYYLMTDKELDSSVLKRLSIFDWLTIIPVGEVFRNLTSDDTIGLSSANLLQEGSPNALYGYISALTIYRSVFGSLPDTVTVLPESESVLSLVPGEGEAARNALLRRLPAVISRTCIDFY